MQERSRRCPDCAGGAFVGNGKCSRCDGTGINVNVASSAPGCPSCRGTGVCATCGGEGVYPPPQDVKVIQKLFE